MGLELIVLKIFEDFEGFVYCETAGPYTWLIARMPEYHTLSMASAFISLIFHEALTGFEPAYNSFAGSNLSIRSQRRD